jgi:Family of unknown function (DUF6328)
MDRAKDDEREDVRLSQAASYLIEECRMVLPGVQALFGFQLIAVFDSRFEDLAEHAQWLHFASLTLVALAVGLVMAPAAYHRITGVRHVSVTFLSISSRFLLASMLALSIGISLDYYVVGWLMFESVKVAAPAALLCAILTALWFVFPYRRRALHKKLGRPV